jgi:molybdate transport system substrate-binding protein
VVVPLGGQKLDALPQLLDPRFARIGVANPRTSPLGRYTRQALEELNFEARLEDKRIPAEHARQVVDYVARGEVDAGVIYATDANRFADRVSIALKIDPDLHSPIVYQAALLAGDPPRDWARRLFEFLCSDASRTPWPGRR